jgi:phosphopantothenoylcysteine decarboxylase/phosphopantothenate--cysteine ligase
VLLAVSGSIAAFKGAALTSELVKAGYAVRVILTSGGEQFVTRLTFEALTGNPVSTEIWDEQPGSSRMGHLDLARWADVLVVAPASANTIARLALGLADDLLGATSLAFTGPVIVAPAMETAMHQHPATQEHLLTLRERDAVIIGPESGRLASGAQGQGRMSEPERIVEQIRSRLGPAELDGCRILVTAGPTYEPIDRVRFIGNRSSGKMGYAIAAEAVRRGAAVLLISGPTCLTPPRGAEVVDVESAAELHAAVMARVEGQQAVVMAAAVADFRPESPVQSKIRRAEGLSLSLVATQDIAAAAAAAAPTAFHVGFALEAEDLVASARRKLERKGQHLVVANAISEEQNPFGSDRNRVAFVSRDEVVELPEMSKAEVAKRICDEIVKWLVAGRSAGG